MKLIVTILLSVFFWSCDDQPYKLVQPEEMDQFVTQKTLVSNKFVDVKNVGDSISDAYPRLLVKTKAGNHYLFNYDCRLENDSIILHYGDAFIIDDHGEFRENGIWIYAKFTSEGTFPFTRNSISYAVDSIPNPNIELPVSEGIYIYENGKLKIFSKDQSEARFNEQRRDGFYFIPNKGRFFQRLNINKLE